MRTWTVGRTITIGVVVAATLMAIVGIGAYNAITSLTTYNLSVAHTHAVLERAASLIGFLKDAETGQRGFVITGIESYLEPYNIGRDSFPSALLEARRLTADNPIQQARLAQIETLAQQKFDVLARTIEMRRTSFDRARDIALSGEGKRIMDDTRLVVSQMIHEEQNLLQVRNAISQRSVANARIGLSIGTAGSLLVMIFGGWWLVVSLKRRIGDAVGQVQSSAAELQSAAGQQATSAKEQANSMHEISTTISELVATSRQIAESAQSVARIAEQTAASAKHGGVTVERGQEAMTIIRRQVDSVVSHMLDLGNRSQQISGVVEIVSELAEQTNILAINATIEAAGAGEGGKRFGVVADEIRRLADRVGNSTKEIRGLIDGVHNAVNTTVMATETSAKAVEAGGRQFADVAIAIRQIAGLVGTSTDAAREIELSTKQQATAAEQVRMAVGDVTQATKETEASTGQTVQTAAQLTALARDLHRIVVPVAARA